MAICWLPAPHIQAVCWIFVCTVCMCVRQTRQCWQDRPATLDMCTALTHLLLASIPSVRMTHRWWIIPSLRITLLLHQAITNQRPHSMDRSGRLRHSALLTSIQALVALAARSWCRQVASLRSRVLRRYRCPVRWRVVSHWPSLALNLNNCRHQSRWLVTRSATSLAILHTSCVFATDYVNYQLYRCCFCF